MATAEFHRTPEESPERGGGSASPEAEITHHGAALAIRRSQSEAIELAYGLLWHVSVDNGTERGRCITMARLAMLEQIDKPGQARGITAAREKILRMRSPEKTPEGGGDAV
ncbi:hypothetical protein ACSHT2_02525 [Bradyrhizobium sp. PUT101]|uniref:hypothetical protein n=1 Tax=Bradyrhizobium sp. PUT101 TaxID=3447427 RepID=UPI003F848226